MRQQHYIGKHLSKSQKPNSNRPIRNTSRGSNTGHRLMAFWHLDCCYARILSIPEK